MPSVLVPPLCRVLLLALSKPPLCRVPVICRVLSLWHSANSLFVERPIKSTRQSLGHSAKKPSPVVNDGIKTPKNVLHSSQIKSEFKLDYFKFDQLYRRQHHSSAVQLHFCSGTSSYICGEKNTREDDMWCILAYSLLGLV